MLASIIDRLTSLISKYLVIGFFLPVLMFAFVTAAITYHEFSRFREWARPEISGTAKAFDVVVILVGLSIVAYLFSVLSTFLREILEGKHLLEVWPALMQRLQARQQERLTKIQTEYITAKREHELITRKKATWRETLSNAASTGMQRSQNVSGFDSTSPTAKQIDDLQILRSQAKGFTSDDIGAAVKLLATTLET